LNDDGPEAIFHDNEGTAADMIVGGVESASLKNWTSKALSHQFM